MNKCFVHSRTFSSFSLRKSVDIICNCKSFLSLNFYRNWLARSNVFIFFRPSSHLFNVAFFYVTLLSNYILVRNRRDGIDPMAFDVVIFFFFFLFLNVFFFFVSMLCFFCIFFPVYSFFFSFCRKHSNIFFFFRISHKQNFFIASRFFSSHSRMLLWTLFTYIYF